MKLAKRLVISTLMLVLLSLVGTTALAQSETDALIRFAHVIPGASAVDIYTDGQLTVRGLDFGQASTYANIASGTHTITVTPAGITTSLWEQDVNVGSGAALTLVASSTDPLSFRIYEDDFTPLTLGQARFRIIHAAANTGALDALLSDGRLISGNLNYGDATGTIDVPSFAYEIGFAPTGQSLDNAIVPVSSFSLDSNTSYMLIVYGTAATPDTLLLSAPTAADGDSGLLRLVNGVKGADAVDVYVDDTRVAPTLGFGQATNHIVVATGSHSVAVRAAGSDGDPLATGSITVDAGSAQTAVAMGTADAAAVGVFTDSTTAINDSVAFVTVINAISADSSVSVSLADGTSLGDSVDFGAAGSVASFSPAQEDVSVSVALGDQSGSFTVPSQAFYGGVYYDAVAFAGDSFTPPTLAFFPTSLAQGIASAPGAGQMTVAMTGGTSGSGASSDNASSEVVPAPVATEAAPPTPAEVVQTQETPAPVVQQTSTDLPTAQVLLDPGANLQLRQYPSSEAFSLGLAPSGTVLIVNGREGAPEYPDGVEPPPDATPFVDPATLLADPKDDLDPQQTWLNVTYNTPDGGTIVAWVNAFYLEVRDKRGRLQRLADLPMVPNNRAGEASNTSITPPPVPEDRVSAAVINLNTGVNLNIRRTPTTDGEVLERLTLGTTVELVGLNEAEDWAFIIYRPSQSGEISGWVSSTYLDYSYHGRRITVDDLKQHDLLVTIPEDRRGAITAGTTTSSAPTPNPLKDVYVAEVVLDPGANLHLRRNPDSTSESLNLIPSGSRVVVSERSVDGQWLHVTFEDQDGWISSQYVTLSYNGRTADVMDIPAAVTAPTATPAAGG